MTTKVSRPARAERTATLERLCWDMVSLCNQAFILDHVDFANTAAVRASLTRAHAYVNIGLEYLSNYRTEQLVPLLTARSLISICQAGFSLSMRLRQRASHLQTHLNRAGGVRRALPELARHVVDGLLQAWHPQFFTGLESPGDPAYRDFLHFQDVRKRDRDGGATTALWRGRAVKVLHFNGWGREKYHDWRDRLLL